MNEYKKTNEATVALELTIGEMAAQIRETALTKMNQAVFDKMCRDFEAEIPLYEDGTRTPGKSIWRYQYLGLLHTLKNGQPDQRFIELAVIWLAKHGTTSDSSKRLSELLANFSKQVSG